MESPKVVRDQRVLAVAVLAKCLVDSENGSMTTTASTAWLFEVEMGEAEAPRPAAPAGEAKTFRRYDQSQCYLLRPSLDEWLDDDDEARFVSEVVENLLDLSPIYRCCSGPFTG